VSLVVEIGSGSEFAESWRSKIASEQEAILRKATRHIERAYGSRFVGRRARNEQALAWPRWSAETRDGRLIDGDEIPHELKRGCYEAVRRILAGTTLLADVESVGAVRRERVKAGSAEVETEYASGSGSTGAAQAQKYPEIELEIAPLLHAGSRLRRA
jgi:hypothetical protein